MNDLYEEVTINLDDAVLNGDLKLVEDSDCIIIFVHGSGSGRNSPRNKFVAERMIKNGLSVLLIDLLTEDEERVDNFTREYRFDIPMLSKRVIKVKKWIQEKEGSKNVGIGLYGSSTGAAAALIASAEDPEGVTAVVSRGGRVDLAVDFLHKVMASTLFIVGSRDTTILYANKQALEKLVSKKKLELVSGAGHLFSEPGTLEEVTRLSIEWFKSNC